MNFATLKGLTIPEGVVTQITDASGRVLWMLSGGKVILQVEKITSDTVAGEVTYTGEQFILLSIYPKTNGTVKATYGGLTKTITDTSGAEEPNAQEVFFGTFNGESDSVTTPASGTLTIEGDFYAVGEGTFGDTSKAKVGWCNCVTAVIDLGNVTTIPYSAFTNCAKVTNVQLPDSVQSIANVAFQNCTGLTSMTIPDGVMSIGMSAFSACVSLREVTVGAGVKTIGYGAFDSTNTENALTTVRMLCATPPELLGQSVGDTFRYYTFGDTASKFFVLEEIIVPKGCGNAYKTATSWTEFTDYIVEAS